TCHVMDDIRRVVQVVAVEQQDHRDQDAEPDVKAAKRRFLQFLTNVDAPRRHRHFVLGHDVLHCQKVCLMPTMAPVWLPPVVTSPVARTPTFSPFELVTYDNL